MKIKRCQIFLVVLLFSLNGLSQTKDHFKKETAINPLLGQWEAYKKTDLDGGDGSDVTFNGLPYTVKLELIFLDGDKSFFNNGEGSLETSYTLKEDTPRWRSSVTSAVPDRRFCYRTNTMEI